MRLASATRSRTRSERRSSRSASCGYVRCRRRVARRSCDVPFGRRRSGKIQATYRPWRIQKRWRRSRPLPELDGQVALVTGGGRGIGANIARELAAAGAQVAVWARSAEEVQATAREIGGLGIAAGVSQYGDVARMGREVVS